MKKDINKLLVEIDLRIDKFCNNCSRDFCDNCYIDDIRVDLFFYFNNKNKKWIDYKEYLKSDYWIELSNNLKAKFNKCQLCGNKQNLNVHHNNYDCLYKETEKDLIVLCKLCHRKFHNIRKDK